MKMKKKITVTLESFSTTCDGKNLKGFLKGLDLESKGVYFISIKRLKNNEIKK